jgi:hypothetical protein
MNAPTLTLVAGRDGPTNICRLWEDYLRARDVAQYSRAIGDGLACGRAWRRFLEAFEEAPQ